MAQKKFSSIEFHKIQVDGGDNELVIPDDGSAFVKT